MIYELHFSKKAWKEWNKLDSHIRRIFFKKLESRLSAPRVPGDRLRNCENYYKIKLRDIGYRLVYEVNDGAITVLVIKIGKRDDIYKGLQ